MSRRSDDGSGMPATHLPDDDTIDALVRGDEVDPRWRDLATFAADVRACGEHPPPRPSPALAAVMASGAGVHRASGRTRVHAVVDRSGRRRARRQPARLAKAAGVGLALKIGLGASAAAAGVAGAGAVGVLPGDADAPVRHALETVTPLRFSDDPGVDTAEPAGEPAGDGHAPSDDASARPQGDHGSAPDRRDDGQGARDGAGRDGGRGREGGADGVRDDTVAERDDAGSPERADAAGDAEARPADGGSAGGTVRPGDGDDDRGGQRSSERRTDDRTGSADRSDRLDRSDRAEGSGRPRYGADADDARAGRRQTADRDDDRRRDRRYGDGWREPAPRRAELRSR